MQKKHYAVSYDACRRAALPDAFCKQVATETYNTDAYEFDDLAAHSQIPDGSSACDAVNASLSRLRDLGLQARQALVANNPAAVASALGRALHTVQDNCAHHGMPNPQHAWHSLKDSCKSTSESPDLDPAAASCAVDETAQVMAAFVRALAQAGIEPTALGRLTVGGTHWPGYGSVCSFLASASVWDGTDGRWENSVVQPALRDQLVAALSDDNAASIDPCANGADAIALSQSLPDLDISGGAQSCISIHVFCLGKADSAEEVAPPYENNASEQSIDAPTPSAPSAAVHAAGCSMAGSQPMPGMLAMLFGVAGILLRRRRR